MPMVRGGSDVATVICRDTCGSESLKMRLQTTLLGDPCPAWQPAATGASEALSVYL